jgi:hypothetical protein
MVYIEYESREELTCKVLDITGKMVQGKQIEGHSSVNITGLPAGIYFLRLKGELLNTTLKVLKQL